jgi:type IV pilus assembly protein PilY1
MKTSTIKAIVAVALLLAATGRALAEDIDIFSGGSSNGAPPNIVIVLDTASSNDAAFSSPACPYLGIGNTKLLDAVRCALATAVDQIRNQPVALLGKLRIGVMAIGRQSNQGGRWINPDLSPPTPPAQLPLMDTAGINTLLTNIQAHSFAGNDASNARASPALFQESWAFFTGHVGLSGTDYSSHVTLSCQKSFIIYIGAAAKQGSPAVGNGNVDLSTSADPAATAAQKTQINTAASGPNFIGPNNGDDYAWTDEWARYLYQTDFNSSDTGDDKQNIVTYTIAATGGNPDAAYVQHLASVAKQGGGKAFVGADVNSMVQELLKIFNEVAAINSVFASASLPLSASIQGTYQNQVFLGMFRPDAQGNPRWLGNLKQYQFSYTGTPPNIQLFLADAENPPQEAISSDGKGFISPNAISFWTTMNTSQLPDSMGGFWVNNPQGAGGGYDSPDGQIVEKGGVGQQIRLANLTDDYIAQPSTPRKVYTCWGASGMCASGASLSVTQFATSNGALNAAALGINNPVYTQSVTNISRVSSTGIVTVQLAAAPNPAITDATTVTIHGSAGGQFDYNLAGDSPSASGTTVTYTLPAELPPTSLTNPSAWTVSGAASGVSNVTSLTRTNNAGLITVTAVLSDLAFGGSTTLAAGESINIANSNGYNGTGTVVTVNTGTRTVTYTMSETPSVYGGGGKISVGSSTCTTNGNNSNKNCDNIGPSNTNPPSAGQANLPGLVRGTNCTTCVANSGNVLMVNFPGGTSQLNKVTPATGVQAFIQSGALPANYVNTTTGWKIVGIGANCKVTETHTDGTLRTYTGTATSGSTYYTLCLDLGAAFALTPAVSGNGATVSPQTTATRQGAYTRTVSSLARGASSCTGTGSGATANNATVTITTTAAHGFSVGEIVQVSTGTPGPNESAYIGPATILTVPSPTQFTYTIGTTPACKDTTAGMTITYQSTVGGIDPNDLIRWTRGDDNIGDEQSPGNGITIRPSVHGDVVHSRPAVVNYGTPTGVVVFYGSNDGTFRAINGNQTASIGSVPAGGELWAFIPKEFFSKLQRLYSNSPALKLASTPNGITPTPQPKDYFFDGATGVYQDPVTGNVYIYLSARRGGRLIYALDVTNPAVPKFMWKVGCPSLTDNTTCDTGFAELGQTWSQPKIVKVKGHTNPVLIFGAGYDANEDTEPPTTDTMGRGIFILDAIDGSIVWQATGGGASNFCTGTPCQLLDMKYAIAADITLLDRTKPDGTKPDGYVERLYGADMGGTIWRVDLEPAGGNTPAFWQVTKLAALGGTGTTKRKFLYPPDILTTSQYDAIMAGTGDREHPVYQDGATSIVNRFYMIKDMNIGNDASGWITVSDTTSSTADIAPASLFHVVLANCDPNASPPVKSGCYDGSLSGFYITLPNAGEKVVNAPTTIGGFTYFGTNQPTAPNNLVCGNGTGTARDYQVNFVTGSTASGVLDTGGLPPSPVAGLVDIDINGGTLTVPFLLGGNPSKDCVGPDCKSSIGGTRPPIPISPTRRRLYWYQEKLDK